jgi:3-oxoacyl-[acyl-carrier-protein] synthase-3
MSSVAVSLPRTVVGNAEIAPRIGVTDEWIVRRTGIHSRHIAAPEERLATHAIDAGSAALERAGVAAEDVELVLVATTTPDEVMPNSAPLVAHGLGARHAGAFDIGAACTGFLSALAVGVAQIESGRCGCALVIGADFMSRITDPGDRSTRARWFCRRWAIPVGSARSCWVPTARARTTSSCRVLTGRSACRATRRSARLSRD